MNPYTYIREQVIIAIEALINSKLVLRNLDFTNLTIEAPRDPDHGDLATNAALILTKQVGRKPRDIAESLITHLGNLSEVTTANIAGPGFINLRLSDQFWRSQLIDVLLAGASYGNSNLAGGAKINIEYVSANPTGPLHIGHVRGAVYGDALANLLTKVGYNVCKEYYINDAGVQIDLLARSVYLRYCEALGDPSEKIQDGMYPGDYLIPVGKAIAAREGDKWHKLSEEAWLDFFRTSAVDAMMDLIREDLKSLGIKQGVFFSEKMLHMDGGVERSVDALSQKDLLYTGVLDHPKGSTPDDWEPRQQTLFKSTKFGDDLDRPLRKSDGSWTYFAADVAYHHDKLQRGFLHMVDVLGADHGGYVKRLKAAVHALSDNEGSLDVRLCQMVRLSRDGKIISMSKRAGTFVTLKELIDEVGKDVVRFMMLTRKNDAPLDFDFNLATEQSKDNPVWYVQYAHARICSVLRRVTNELPTISISPEKLCDAEFDLLNDSDEINLIRQLAGWPRAVEIAAEAREPHRISFYLSSLASDFHALWNKGNADPSLRFIIDDKPNITQARMALVQGVAFVLASGLEILGVKPVETM